MAGKVREIEAEFQDGELTGLRIEGEGPFEVDCGEETQAEPTLRLVAAR